MNEINIIQKNEIKKVFLINFLLIQLIYNKNKISADNV